MAVDLLNLNVGISQVLPQAETAHLPSVDDFNTVGSSAQTAVQSFTAALKGGFFEEQVKAAFVPVISSDELLQPAKFNAALDSAADKLSGIRGDAAVRRFVREDLAPFMENKELLQAYLMMMVEG